MPWNKTPDVAMYKGADWNGLVNIVSSCTPQSAMRIALKDPTITFFFYCRESMYLEPTGGNSPSPDPTADVKWIVANGYAGVMAFAFETTDNVTLMGTLVDALLGPGNWNQSAAVS